MLAIWWWVPSLFGIVKTILAVGAAALGSFYAYRGLVEGLNGHLDARSIPELAQKILRPFFQDIDLNRVRLVEGASLPLTSMTRMVFGYTIFWEGSFRECVDEDLEDLMHELVHVEQYDKFSDPVFGTLYVLGTPGQIFKRSANRFEAEAIDFTESNKSKLDLARRTECAAEHGDADWQWLLVG